jgi:hypothetical protein
MVPAFFCVCARGMARSAVTGAVTDRESESGSDVEVQVLWGP